MIGAMVEMPMQRELVESVYICAKRARSSRFEVCMRLAYSLMSMMEGGMSSWEGVPTGGGAAVIVELSSVERNGWLAGKG